MPTTESSTRSAKTGCVIRKTFPNAGHSIIGLVYQFWLGFAHHDFDVVWFDGTTSTGVVYDDTIEVLADNLNEYLSETAGH